MTMRYHATPNGPVPFTAAEEAEWDAMEAEWHAGQQAKADAEAARLARIATAKANMQAAQSVPDLRAAVAALFAELGL